MHGKYIYANVKRVISGTLLSISISALLSHDTQCSKKFENCAIWENIFNNFANDLV